MDKNHFKMNLPDPQIFAIETILGCDLKCPECAVGGNFISRKKKSMSFEHFKIIADKIRHYCQYLYLHIWGEPMLNKNIFKMIEYAAPFTKTNISTNGQSVSEEKAELLIKSGVSDILVSIDGLTQQVYEKYRVGGNLNKAKSTLKMLQHFNMKYGKKVNITPQFIVMKHNYHEIEPFKQFCGSLGLTPLFKAPYIRHVQSQFSFSDDKRFQRPSYPDIHSLKAGMCGCKSVKNVFNILLDGSVVACCHDYDKFTFFGNIFNKDVMQIWNSEKFRDFRWSVMSGNAPIFCIEKCMTYLLSHSKQKLRKNIHKQKSKNANSLKINLCSGTRKLSGYTNIDLQPGSDILIDLEHKLLPFPDNSASVIVCISAINYFSKQRALEIIKDVYRVLMPGGIARFATQDLRILVEKYLQKDSDFFFQKLSDGKERFPGISFGDKLNNFFYGFQANNKTCKFVYDYETLSSLFEEANFCSIKQKKYQESDIPEIAEIDNRPEQMFFLEAHKKKSKNLDHLKNKSSSNHLNDKNKQNEESITIQMKNKALNLWENGKNERAWNLFLKILETIPTERIILLKCIEILDDLKRYEDLLRLVENYLALRPDDLEIKKIALITNKNLHAKNMNIDDLRRRQIDLIHVNRNLNKIRSDEMHLSACMSWLLRAQDANPGGGVSATYHMDKKYWDVDYPETTGYIISTFICYSKLTCDDFYLNRAIEMGNWEIAIQSSEGGAGEPVGVYGLSPRIFNTGQVLIGWIALYQETKNNAYLNSAIKAANWIIDNQDPDGKWTKSTYSGPKAYHSRVAWSLSELYAITKIEKFRIAAERSMYWIFLQAKSNGWFANNSLSVPDMPWTHLIGYVLVGLLEIFRLNQNNREYELVLNFLNRAAKNIANFYLKLKSKQKGTFFTLPGTLDPNWNSNESWSCLTGNAQIEFFLRRLFTITGESILKTASDMLIDDLKKIHMIDGVSDLNVYGGLPGSYPINGPYQKFQIPNWGVKFFADCLLQRLLPVDEQKLIG